MGTEQTNRGAPFHREVPGGTRVNESLRWPDRKGHHVKINLGPRPEKHCPLHLADAWPHCIPRMIKNTA